jgi:GAF domain-containing protein
MKHADTPRAHLGILREAAHTLSEALQECEVIRTLLTQVLVAFQAERALARLLNADGTALVLAGALGVDDTGGLRDLLPLGESRVDQRVLAGELVVTEDATGEPDCCGKPEADSKQRVMVSVPLTVRGRVIGVVRVYLVTTATMNPEDLRVLSILAELGALALEKVRLHQSLYRIAGALSSSLELQPMLQAVLQTTVEEMWLKAASIRLIDSKHKVMHLVATYGLSDAYLAKGDVHLDKSPVDQRALQDEVVVLYDVEHEPGLEYPEEAAREGIRSVLAVPLHLKKRTVGVMRVYSAQPRHFGPVAMSFLASIADLVALAIENAELHAALESRYKDLKLDLAEWRRFLALG